MARCNAQQVLAVLGENYDRKRAPNIAAFIAGATAIVDQVKAMSLKKSRVVAMGGLTSADLLNIETWLAAHLYCIRDPLYMSRSTQGASGSFQRGAAKEGFAITDYGKTAMDLDWSGCLKNISLSQFASSLKITSADVSDDAFYGTEDPTREAQ